ncbi:MAG: alanine racemase [Proteobacteria bacterium]|nr:alanine racemase [Pseudomonadota bacterium]
MRCWIELDAAALRHNFQVFQNLSSADSVVAVVKSNAYGHGLAEIYQALLPNPPQYLGVNYLSEAESLRKLGFMGKIMVLGPIHPEASVRAAAAGAEIFLTEEQLLTNWLLLPPKQRPAAHIKFDTGMSRQGFLPEQTGELIARLQGEQSSLIGICSHFANVEDVLEQGYAKQQLQSFTHIAQSFEQAGFKLKSHIAASSSALLMPDSRLDLMRIGISLYGLWPSRATQLSYLQQFGKLIELKPVLSWKTEVAIVKAVKAGRFIGYGCTYKALRDMQIAVLPIGYNEGYPRLASNRGHVLLRNQRCPIIGRICMNMMMIDISHLPQVAVGDLVTLIGHDGPEHIDASQIGEWTDTIHYEILTQLNPNIPKRLVP